MQIFSFIALLPAVVVAQAYGGGAAPVSSSTTSAAAPAQAASTGITAAAKNHIVTVAQSDFSYTPDTITADVGDTVQFMFANVPHSVVQSTFASPCVQAGFFSGILNSKPSNNDAFTITVNDTTPIWVFCAVPTHCEQFGMSMVINPPANSPNTLDAYKSAAKALSNPPSPSATTGGSFAALMTSAASSSGAAPASTTTPAGGAAAPSAQLGWGGLGVAVGALLFAAGLV